MSTTHQLPKEQQDYLNFLQHYCSADPDALLFVLGYSVYVHAIDDIIDGDKDDHIHILKTFELAAMVYSNQFYLRHIHELRPLVVMASSTYMTSVTLEKATNGKDWKLHVADALRQTGNELFLAVIQILHGIDVRIEASLKLREISYLTHHLPDGTPC